MVSIVIQELEMRQRTEKDYTAGPIQKWMLSLRQGGDVRVEEREGLASPSQDSRVDSAAVCQPSDIQTQACDSNKSGYDVYSTVHVRGIVWDPHASVTSFVNVSIHVGPPLRARRHWPGDHPSGYARLLRGQ